MGNEEIKIIPFIFTSFRVFLSRMINREINISINLFQLTEMSKTSLTFISRSKMKCENIVIFADPFTPDTHGFQFRMLYASCVHAHKLRSGRVMPLPRAHGTKMKEERWYRVQGEAIISREGLQEENLGV